MSIPWAVFGRAVRDRLSHEEPSEAAIIIGPDNLCRAPNQTVTPARLEPTENVQFSQSNIASAYSCRIPEAGLLIIVIKTFSVDIDSCVVDYFPLRVWVRA